MKNNSPEILYTDQSIIVAVKPGGLLSVPGRGPDKKDCLVNRLKKQFPDMPEQPAVHRLDMYTSGVMVFARTVAAHKHLSKQFMERRVEKIYDAVVEGVVTEKSGVIELSFRLDVDNRPLQIYDPLNGKLGVTRWQKISTNGERTHIRFFPLTGRTHQLRVHAAHPLGLGRAILGDSLYGSGREGDAMFLHASKLTFQHPDSSQIAHFSSLPPFPLPV